jgi:peptidyl-prolyl cis-trans isomerase-like 3
MSTTLHTTLGDIKLELFVSDAPLACENFLALCASNYYDDCVFHRCVKSFMVQTGDPTGTGRGGACVFDTSRSVAGRGFADEIVPHVRFSRRGMLAMANSGPGTNQSQFFISFAKLPHLDGRVTIFGRVIDGHGTLDALERLQVDERDRPVRDVKIERVTIHANPLAG